ncbi:MAG: hypothetical protein ACR2IK_18230 [Chloroflexota bacterium]
MAIAASPTVAAKAPADERVRRQLNKGESCTPYAASRDLFFAHQADVADKPKASVNISQAHS